MASYDLDRDEKLVEAALEEVRAAGRSMAAVGSVEQVLGWSLDGYTIHSTLGRGGQGTVYRATHEPTKRSVAIKVLDTFSRGDVDARRFEREMRILGGLRHPNIVAVHDGGCVDGRYYHVMDVVEGVPLLEFAQGEKLDLGELIELFLKVCHALSATHARGVLHRDLKPGNVLVDDSAEPRVLDFGLAKLLDPAEVGSMRTTTGQFVGSLPWASPEQTQARSELVDLRSDVYALGVVLYQLLTGGFPYPVRGTLRDVVHSITHVDPRPPSQMEGGRLPGAGRIDDDLDTITLRCLAKHPDRRYQSAGELAADLERWQRREPVEAKRENSAYVLRKYLYRFRTQVAIAVLILVAILGSLITSVTYWRNAVEDRGIAEEATAQANRRRDQAEATRRFVESMFSSLDPNRAAGEEVLVRTVLEGVAPDLESVFVGQPLVEADIRMILGRAWFAIGEYDSADGHFQRATELRQLELGELHAEALDALAYWSMAHERKPMPTRTSELFIRAMDDCERAYGPDHRETLSATLRWAASHILEPTNRWLLDRGWAGTERGLLEETLERCEREFGPEDELTLEAARLVALCLTTLSEELDRAVVLSGHVLDSRLRTLGEAHTDTLDAMAVRAAALMRSGNQDDALELQRRVLEGNVDLRGPEHRETMRMRLTLAGMFELTGRLEEADVDLRATIDYFEATEGFHGGAASYARAILTRVLVRQERNLGELRASNQVVIAKWEAAAAEEDCTWEEPNQLAWWLLTSEPEDLRDLPRAVEIAERALALPGGHNCRVLDTLALAYFLTGRVDQCIETQREAVELLPKDSLGWLDRWTARLDHYIETREGHRDGWRLVTGNPLPPK